MPGFSGRNARITYNANDLTATRFTISTRGDELEVTSFESNGNALINNNLFTEYQAGISEAELSFDAYWDSAMNPHINAPFIVAGQRVNSVIVNLDRQIAGNARTYTFTDFYCLDVTIEAEVRGIVRYSVRGKGHLGVTLPNGQIQSYNTVQ